jgi:uncharacterized Zn finger protein
MPTATARRQIKAIQIAIHKTLIRNGRVWLVPSDSSTQSYRVDPDPEFPHCTCPDFEKRQARCKHIYAVEYYQLREQMLTKKGNEK